MIVLSHFLIVEDELLIAETISDFLKKEGAQNITIVESVEEALSHIETNHTDLVLTDIALGNEQTGIDLGNLLYTKYHIPFIYITSHADKAMINKVKHTRPNGYIVKPFKKDDLLVAIELALYNAANTPLKSNENNELIVKDGRALVKLFHDNIVWLEADGNYTTIHLINNKRHVIRTTLTEMEEQLPSDYFIRIHKSYVVNKKHITEVRANNVIIDQKELAIGRTFQQNLVNVF